MATTEKLKILVPGHHPMVSLVGQRDELLKLIEGAFSASILVRGNEITISGPKEETDRAATLFEELIGLLDQGQELTAHAVEQSIDMVRHDESPSRVLTDDILRAPKGKPARPKTAGQKRYVDAIRENVITFGLGPAGRTAVALAFGAFGAGVAFGIFAALRRAEGREPTPLRDLVGRKATVTVSIGERGHGTIGLTYDGAVQTLAATATAPIARGREVEILGVHGMAVTVRSLPPP